MYSASFHTSRRVVSQSLVIFRRQATQRWSSNNGSKVDSAAGGTPSAVATKAPTSYWTNPELWGFLAALSGWTMSIAAFSDSLNKGPEVISLPMTSVLTVYSSLFLRWSFVVRPQNLFLGACHFANICAQLNQGRRAVEYKLENGKQHEVEEVAKQAGLVVATIGGSVLVGPLLQRLLVQQNLGRVSSLAASDAGPFRIHFWAPMSKWMISGASLWEYNRPTDKISISQYSSLTLCGVIQSWYPLLVTPVNYMLCSVNLALFLSSGWHLGRKLKADYFDHDKNER